MSDQASGEVEALLGRWKASGRLIGTWDSGRPGPAVLVVGAIHGNEPAGVDAARRAIEHLHESDDGGTRGRVVALIGNRRAYRAERRFLDRDLNRHWSRERVELLHGLGELERCREDHEQLDLLEGFQLFDEAHPEGLVLLDLHSTTGAAPPFSVICQGSDPAASLALHAPLARAVGCPLILGFDHFVDAPILSWFDERGHRAIGVEGGSHLAPETEALLEATIWRTLCHVGVIHAGVTPRDAERWAKYLEVQGVPDVLRVIHRHRVVPGSGFGMEPGFANFQPVQADRLLATDRTGGLRAPWAGRIFLPRYQDEGEDGFFLVVDQDDEESARQDLIRG